ncbi:MAG: hypothetical protein JWN13_3430 [Betaproteobacteria bacterium]|nr:hypothetical protein [Betaproteobacteria bacterium]
MDDNSNEKTLKALRRIVRITAMVAFPIVLVWSDAVLGCSCFTPTPQQLVESTTLIFRGQVQSVDAKAGRARFTVERLYKGVVQGTEIEIRYNNGPGSMCGTGFMAGGTETVFANGDTGSFVTGMCQMIPYQSAPLKFQPALDAYRLAVLEAVAVTDSEPNSWNAWLGLARVHETYRDHLAVISALDHVLEIGAASADVHTRRGEALAALQRFRAALEEYDKALALEPQNGPARRGRDQALLKLGRVAEIDPDRRD